MQSRNHFQGFSLLEQAVVISITSIIVIIMAIFYSKQYEAEKIQITKDKIEKIERAIIVHFLDNAAHPGTGLVLEGSFPCPASPTALQTTADFGVQKLAGVDCSAVSGVSTNNSYFYGVVPVKTLKIPEDYMYDGWGRRFSFVVKKTLIPPTVTTGIGSDSDTNEILYSIISHGKNGLEAYTKAGGLLGDSSDTGEINNSIEHTDFRDVEDKPHTSTYDDIVVSRSLGYFIRQATGGSVLLSSGFCKRVKDLSPTGSQCVKLQSKIKAMCIKYVP